MTFTNVEEQPMAASEAAERILADDGNIPITPPPDTEIELPAGLITGDGRLLRTAEVRELTGEDEEYLARGGNSSSLSRYFHSILTRAVLRIGNLEPDYAMLQGLLIGDRSTLLLGIRRATYGDDYEIELTCPKCDFEFGVAIELHKDVPIRVMENPMVREHTVELRHGVLAKVRFPNGADQEAALSDNRRTIPEQNTIILGRCVTEIDGRPIIGDETVRKMGLQDRATLMKFLADNQPGPQFGEVSVPCSSCGESSTVALSMEDLFRG